VIDDNTLLDVLSAVLVDIVCWLFVFNANAFVVDDDTKNHQVENAAAAVVVVNL
jgi:hypothetical protein